ncbi:MAG: TetR/AcrR family transcriptional regulator [Pseudomonadota bacterium]
MPSPESPLRGKARQNAVLNAAMHLFSQHGARQVSIGAIAEAASASKETVYRHFGNRDGLLIAVLKRFCSLTLSQLPKKPVGGESFEEGLSRLGFWYLKMVTRPETLSFYRYIVGEVERSPSLGPAFTNAMTRPIVAEFASHMESVSDPSRSLELAEAFLGLLQGKLWNRALVEPDAYITKSDLEAQVRMAVELFAPSFLSDNGSS